MKKNTLYFLMFFCIELSLAQVGVGTTNPQADLHIAGENSTIRLEGLNMENHPVNDGLRLMPTLVDTQGRIILSNQTTTVDPFILTDASSMFSQRQVVNIVEAASATQNIYNYEITITAEAFVEIKYSVPYLVYGTYNENTQQGTKIQDGRARQIQTYFTIDGGDTKYGMISQNYYNVHTGGGVGQFFNAGFAFVGLEPGTYILNFYANILASPTNTTAIVFGGADSLLRFRFYQ
jgi:hypothetical protein